MSDRLPSTDLYFAHANGHLINRWWRRAPIKALGANCFSAGNTLVLIRRDEEALMHRALDWPGRFIYVIDDDVGAAREDPHLPDHYRARLAVFDRDHHRQLIRRADVLLVPSARLADRLASDANVMADIRHINPVWNLPIVNQDHYSSLSRGGALRIVHLGSGSHAGAIAAIAPAVSRLLERHDNIQFTYIGRKAPHASFAQHPQVRRIPPMRWPRYRRWLARQRFHLALYPLDQTPFDRARSGNKLIEHGIIGAAGIYPRDWSPADILGSEAILAPSDPADWFETLIQTVADRDKLACYSAKAATALHRYNAPQIQRELWRLLLSIEIDSGHV